MCYGAFNNTVSPESGNREECNKMRKLRKVMKKGFVCAVLAAISTVAVFAQSGAGGADADIAKYTEAIRLNPNNAAAYF